MTSSQKIREKQKKYIFDAVKNYYKEPIVVSEAKGSIVKDLDGKSYLDFFGGILTVSIGHANEEVNSAVKAQISNLTHISSLYPSIPVVELAERLVNLAPKNLNKVFLNATGTEADETAVMLAQLYTGNTEILALRHGYSGRSMLAQSLTAHAPWRAIPTQIASVKHAMAPYCYRCPLKLSPKNCGTACATDVEELIQTTTTGKIAGILVEPIMGVGGFITPPKEYFSIVADIVRKYGGIFISDEVQTGFGRTGKTWGIEHYGVEPDMITVAKGIANGFPLAAVISTKEIADSLEKNTISTFGGNPVSCAAAIAAFDVIKDEDLINKSKELGAYLNERLLSAQAEFPDAISEIRGIGLWYAFDIKPKKMTMHLVKEMQSRGVIVGSMLNSEGTIRVAPPLTIRPAEIDAFIGVLKASLRSIKREYRENNDNK